MPASFNLQVDRVFALSGPYTVEVPTRYLNTDHPEAQAAAEQLEMEHAAQKAAEEAAEVAAEEEAALKKPKARKRREKKEARHAASDDVASREAASAPDAVKAVSPVKLAPLAASVERHGFLAACSEELRAVGGLCPGCTYRHRGTPGVSPSSPFSSPSSPPLSAA